MKLYTTIKEIYLSLDHGDRRLFESFNLSAPQFFLLKHISENPGVSLTALSTLMLTDKSNITRLVRRVESKGLVCRKRNRKDGRVFSVFLTDEGGSLFAKAKESHETYNQERFSSIQSGEEDLLDELVRVKLFLENQLG